MADEQSADATVRDRGQGLGWTIAAVIVDDASRSILLERSTGEADSTGASLPTVELRDGEPSADLTFDLIGRLLGRAIAPLWLHYEEADDDLMSGVGAVMAPADTARDASNSREFVPAAEVIDRLESEVVRRHVRGWLDRLAGHPDPRTPPWLDPDWHPRVSGWIAERMTAAGLKPSGPSRLSYQSPLGAVLRTPAGDRDVYMKCPAALFRAEASVTQALAARTPGWVPEVIDIEPTEGWLLMADLGDHQLGTDPEPAWADGLRRLGEIERAWVGHGEELLAAGAAHRPLAALAEAVPGLLELGNLASRLDPSALERWSTDRQRLIDACHELEDIGVPEALVHGDAHPWNVAVTEGGPVVFDWSDTAFGPAFVDLAVFLWRAKDVAGRRELRDAYLDAWADIAPRHRLERAAELAMPVGALYQVTTYQTLLPQLPPWDQAVYAGADAHWLRNAIDALDRGLESLDQRRAAG